MGRVQWDRVADGIKTFLLSKRSREALIFFLFVCISTGFWLLQTLHETYDMEVQMPLKLTHIPDNIVITGDLPSPLRVTLHDKGTNLIHYYSALSHKRIELDFDEFDNGSYSGHITIPPANIIKRVQPLLDGSTRVTAIHPDTIEFFFNRGLKKRIPVRLKGRLRPDKYHYLVESHFEPDSVTVWALQDILDTLQAAYTVLTTLTDLSQTDVRQVKLAAIKGVKYQPDEVLMTTTVDVYTQKQVEVPVVGVNFPANRVLRTFPAFITVSFRVGTRNYKRITEDDFVLAVTYEELLNKQDSKLHLQLRSVPEGVSQVSIKPDVVDFLIEQNEETTEE